MLTLGQSDRFANHKAGTWQLISVNVNRGTSADVNETVTRLLKLHCARTHLPVVFVLHETRSWDVPNPKLHGYACFGSQFGLATLVVSDRFFKIERSWRTEERCTALLFGSVLVMAVYAPDCRKDLDVYETFVKDVTKVQVPRFPTSRVT